ncbi:serine/threonine-protein kinase [Mycobacterium sp. TY815]|uniref:serine/threonine-protein kinase n=1 Tax=Mycobacterium sp. TY815 TaxID=3050581 RepID=UPI002740BCE1|nr:serine/threonine-protein kinase [Mycobacterium sp. TY815]MDP7702901.1 serine/threonine-protein kinase [Mycobacterium sp. TY815]
MEGTPFGRYRLIELIGRGGMGEVWRAFDTETQRVVAVKVLPANLASDPMFEQRFRREALAAAGLTDPHVVPIHHFGEIEGRLYVDMRLIEGRDLQTVLADGPLEPSRAIGIVEQVASALRAAHRVGLVHRDVKPSNILVAENDFAYLIDFGIARAAGETQMTGTGNVIGTWAYLAPERVTSGQSDARADTYALACVLHECLTGSQPFPGKSIEQQIGGHLGLPPPRPSVLRGELPAALDEVIATGMAKNPDDRYAAVTELAAAARAALTDPVGVQKVDMASRAAPSVSDDETQVADRRPSATDPTLAAPHPPATPDARGRKKFPAKMAAAGLTAVLVVIGTVVAFLVWPEPRKPVPKPPAALANTGPFTGVFTVDYGPETTLGGKPITDSSPTKRQWAVRSQCAARGCVATAVSRATSDKPASDLVFDDIGGVWISVYTARWKCHDQDVEQFRAISLRPRPDGSLFGEARAEDAEGCSSTRTVTVRRTGDVGQADGVDDPTAVAPRVASPAAGARGRYHETLSFKTKTYEYDLTSVTDCLRDATRCMTVFFAPDVVTPLVFFNGSWRQNNSFSRSCAKGGTSTVRNTVDFPMPQPPQDPIGQLTGRGHQEISGSACAANNDYEDKYVRTGD